MIRILLVVIVTLAAFIQAISCTPKEAETIKIGCVLSLSGELGPKGEDRMTAARLAVEEINAEYVERYDQPYTIINLKLNPVKSVFFISE